MTAEFDWWLLIVGLVVGAGLVWLIVTEWPRRDEELADSEIGLEAGWIAAQLRADGRAVDPETAAAILRQHRAYLRLPPPDEIPAPTPPGTPGPVTAVRSAGPTGGEPPAGPSGPEPPGTADPAADGSDLDGPPGPPPTDEVPVSSPSPRWPSRPGG